MCITFVYDGSNDSESDFSLVLASNRDEIYDRPAQSMGPWKEDSSIYGGRDMQSGCEGGTWLAVAPSRKKIGLLLNIPGANREHAKSRGKIVEDFVKNDMNMADYIKVISPYCSEFNDFLFVSVELRNVTPIIHSYNNTTNSLKQWSDEYVGFGNSLPHLPLKKVDNGKKLLMDICSKYNKLTTQNILVEELIKLLRNEHRNLPDPQLESRQPKIYKELSSIFVKVPEGKYGTRTHTVLLVTKLGLMSLIEVTMESPIKTDNPHWKKTEFTFNL